MQQFYPEAVLVTPQLKVKGSLHPCSLKKHCIHWRNHILDSQNPVCVDPPLQSLWSKGRKWSEAGRQTDGQEAEGKPQEQDDVKGQDQIHQEKVIKLIPEGNKTTETEPFEEKKQAAQ